MARFCPASPTTIPAGSDTRPTSTKSATTSATAFGRPMAVVPLLMLLTMSICTRAVAQPPDYHGKLTVAEYAVEDESDLDVNVRYTVGDWSGWLGYFDSREIGQGRLGLEYDLRQHWLYTVPSVQLASHGFIGGSVYSEIGTRLFLIAGASRTNLKPYFNLTFDPNESWQLGAGTHMGEADTIALYCIWDNRLDTGQQITHAILRHYLAKARRLTADVSYKSGHGDGGVYLRGDAESVEFDMGRWFIKGARDEHANFGVATMWRLGGGVRF